MAYRGGNSQQRGNTRGGGGYRGGGRGRGDYRGSSNRSYNNDSENRSPFNDGENRGGYGRGHGGDAKVGYLGGDAGYNNRNYNNDNGNRRSYGRGRGSGDDGYRGDGGDSGHNNRNYNNDGGNRSSYNDGGNRGSYGRGRGGGGEGGYRGGRGGPKLPAKPHVLTGEGAIFPVHVDAGRKAYRYDVSMNFITTDGGTQITSLTTHKRDTRMRALCYYILSIVMRDTDDFGVRNLQIAYDNQNTLFSSQPFTKLSYTVTKEQLTTELQSFLKGNGEITVEISPNQEMEYVDISDLTQYISGEIVLDEDQTVRQVLEIILSQGALNSTRNRFDIVGAGQLYRLDEKPIGRALCTRYGTQKGIRIVEVDDPENAPAKKICPGLIVDFKCSPFYSVGTLLEKVNEFVDADSRNPHVWEDAVKFFSGVKVCPSYDKHRVLAVKSFSDRFLDEITITLEDGEEISMAVFFRTKKHCRLEFPHTRAVNVSGDKGDFPMELLLILPNQRVCLEKVTPYLRDQVHKLNAVPPQVRYENIMNEVYNMEFNNEVTKAFGIHVSTEPYENATDLFERPPKPTIIAGGNAKIQPSDDGKFDLGKHKFFDPCTINRWAILYGTECHPRLVKEFHNTFKNQSQNRGIVFNGDAELIDFDSRKSSFNDWLVLFKDLKRNQVTFVILIDSKSNQHSHNILKLMESVTKVLTQHVTMEVAKNVVEKHQVQTLGNILLKINVKNGGINYKVQFHTAERLDINKGDVLILGYDVAHPAGVSPDERKENMDKGRVSETRDPSTVGITANVLSDPSAFIGDFFFQPTCQEKVDKHELRIYVKQFLVRLQNNRSKLPGIVVILRDGVSEGQFKMTFDDEIPAIRQGFVDFDPSYQPKFVFVICTKRHHKRFFEGSRGTFANPQAGSFIENKFTRPDCIEFYMQCHKAIKGTAKFVQVSVVLNEPEVSKKELFNFLHSLSYGHQIVCSPVSLPTPIYQADELAARGFEVYHSVKQHMPNAIKWENGEIKYYELSTLLNYSDSELGNRRFNA